MVVRPSIAAPGAPAETYTHVMYIMMGTVSIRFNLQISLLPSAEMGHRFLNIRMSYHTGSADAESSCTWTD